MKQPIDHLVYAVQDLHQGIAEIENLTGLRPVIGGRHTSEGTWNALMGLGPNCYFEILAPDPEQEPPARPSWRDTITHLTSHRLLRWCAKSTNLEATVRRAAENNIDLGRALPGSRQKADGSTLSWTLTDIRADPADGIIPFFIDWGNSPHPSDSLPQGCTIDQFVAVHPAAEEMQKKLRVFDLNLPVYPGNEKRLVAHLNTPKGKVLLL